MSVEQVKIMQQQVEKSVYTTIEYTPYKYTNTRVI